VRRLLELPSGGFAVGGFELDLEVFAHVHGLDALVTHVFQRVLNGLSLRIDHGLFRGDDNSGFHFMSNGQAIAAAPPP